MRINTGALVRSTCAAVNSNLEDPTPGLQWGSDLPEDEHIFLVFTFSVRTLNLKHTHSYWPVSHGCSWLTPASQSQRLLWTKVSTWELKYESLLPQIHAL